MLLWPDNTNRHRISLRKAVEVFSRRLAQLESCLRQNGLGVPEEAPEDSLMLRWLTESYGATVDALEATDFSMTDQERAQLYSYPTIPGAAPEVDSTAQVQTNSSGVVEQGQSQVGLPDNSGMSIGGHVPETSQLLPTEKWDVDSDFVWYMSTLPSLSMDINEMMPGSLPTSFTDDSSIELQMSDSASGPSATNAPSMDDEGDTDEDDTAEVTHQFSDRLGTLLPMPNGEWRFYGATSNLHLVHGSFGHDSAVLTHRRADPQACLDNAGVGHVVDDELTSHLVNLYFTWQNPSLYIVDQTGFETARMQYLNNRTKSGLYSELLVNAM